MRYANKKQITRATESLRKVIAIICIIAIAFTGIVYVAAEESRKLLNGSFEEGQTFTDNYSQPNQSDVPSWNTTAFQGKIELFRKNTGTYINGVTLEPKDGTYAAELNADEESTLYQNVKTSPSSVYKWGLDHGGRNGTDIMALVIGPKQGVDPSKPNKNGRDQFMQMVDWLNIDVSKIISGAEPTQYTVYSKKFAASGAFEDNAGNNAFSLTPSSIYTEEWHIWIMASSRAKTGTNPWNSYGSNAEDPAGSGNGSGNTGVDLSKYYFYTVPAAQTNKKIKKLQSERTTLERQISESEKLLKTTKKDVASQLNNLMVISSQITKQQNYVQSVHNEVSALQGDITELQKQLTALEKDLADCKQKYRRAVTQLNRNRLGQSKWKFILSANSFRQMSRRMRYITEYSKYQRAQGEIIRQKEDTIKAKRAELLATKQEKNALLQEGKEQQARLEQQKQDRQKVVNSLNAKQKQLQNTIAQNKKRQKQLDARIDKLIQEEIAAAERRRKEAEARRRAEAERKRKEEERRAAAANKKAAAGKKPSASNKKTSTKPTKPAERTATPRLYEEDNADRALNGSFQANSIPTSLQAVPSM